MLLMSALATCALGASGATASYGRYTYGTRYVTDASDGCAGLYFQPVAEQGETDCSYAVVGCVYPVTTCSSATGDIVIPETLNGLPVRKIQAGAFVGNSSITSVVLPANLREVGDRAFAYCVSLTNVTCAGAGVTSIGENCFSNDLSLVSVTLPNTLQRIGRNAFVLCDKLAWVHFEGNAPMLDGAPADPYVSYFGEKRWTSGTAPARVLFYVNAGTYGWKGPYLGGIPEKWPLAYGFMNAHPVAAWPTAAKALSVHISQVKPAERRPVADLTTSEICR